MAPNGELLLDPYPKRKSFTRTLPPRLSTAENLQRAASDLSFQLSSLELQSTPPPPVAVSGAGGNHHLPPISEVEDAKCECCGMSEECTPEYIRRVRDRLCGKLMCGLCSEAVTEEAEKKGVEMAAAVEAHMSVCVRFNRFGRTHPVLYQAEAMREMLKRSRSKSSSPREKAIGAAKKKVGITRSSSCIPAITREMNQKSTDC